MNNQFTYPKEKIRFAILTFFFAQGLCMASWASRIPDFKDVFAANYAFYWGLILFMIPVGKFVAIPLAGYLVSKLGSRTMVQVSILGYAMSLLCVGLAHEVYLLGFLLFCFGVFWNLCDISFNTQGIEVERLYGKTIMATFHGGWSLGACTGALIGFVMILTGTSPVWHYMLIAAIILIIVWQDENICKKQRFLYANIRSRALRQQTKRLIKLRMDSVCYFKSRKYSFYN